MMKGNILLTQEVTEVSNGVGRVPDEESFGLATIVLVAIYIGQNRGYLTISVFVSNDFGFIVDRDGNGAVGVSKGDADAHTVTRRRARLRRRLAHQQLGTR